MRKLFIVFIVVLSLTALAIPSFAMEYDSLVIPVEYGSIWYDGEFADGEYNVLLYDNAMNVLVSDHVTLVDGNDAYVSLDFTYNDAECELNFTINAHQCFADLVSNGDLMSSFVGSVVVTPRTGELVSVTGELGSVFSGMGVWLASALASLVAIFWTGTSLTLIGVLSVCALAVAFGLFIIYLIRTFW